MSGIVHHPELLSMLLLLLVSVTAYAYDFESNGLKYHILSEEDRTVEVANNEWISGDIEIPRNLVYNSRTYTVTSIGDNAFSSCIDMTSVIIPNSVTSIGKSAFAYCYKLASVTIPNSVSSIGEDAFFKCTSLTSVTIPNSIKFIEKNMFWECFSLTSITIPNSVIFIDKWAFYSCSSLTSVTIPNSVVSINTEAFMNCSSLTSITIPNSVTDLSYDAFHGCSSLANILVDSENTRYTSINGILYNKDVTTLEYCPEAKFSVTIPNTVTSISKSAFHNCNRLKSVTIPNSTTYIADGAFGGCSSLASVTISDSVTYIGNSAFYGCSSLPSVTIPNSVTYIGYEAFLGCSNLTSVTIPNSVNRMGICVFSHCEKIANVYVHTLIPVESLSCFDDKVLLSAQLYVPTGTLANYKTVAPWKYFRNIEEMDFSDVDGITNDSDEELRVSVNYGILIIDGVGVNECVTVYDMQGRVVYNGTSHTVDNLSPSLYIVKAGDKTAKISI